MSLFACGTSANCITYTPRGATAQRTHKSGDTVLVVIVFVVVAVVLVVAAVVGVVVGCVAEVLALVPRNFAEGRAN